MTEHPALVAIGLLDSVNGPDDVLEQLRDLLEALAKLPWQGESGPATEPGSEPETGTNA